MGQEIERKYLLKDDSWRLGAAGVLYRQGYLSTEVERNVRVRTIGERAFLTIKGKGEGISSADRRRPGPGRGRPRTGRPPSG